MDYSYLRKLGNPIIALILMRQAFTYVLSTLDALFFYFVICVKPFSTGGGAVFLPASTQQVGHNFFERENRSN